MDAFRGPTPLLGIGPTASPGFQSSTVFLEPAFLMETMVGGIY